MFFNKLILRRETIFSRKRYQLLCNPYTIHQSVWQLYADHPGRKRDFLYRLELDGNFPGIPCIYTVSERRPNFDSEVWEVVDKPKSYEPKIHADMHLAYTLRANPVCTKRDEKNKHHRHDVVMEAKTCLKERGVNRQDFVMAALAQAEGSKWLEARAEKHGFVINHDYIRVYGYQQHRLLPVKEEKPIRFSTLEFNGLLTVVDPDRFLNTLYYGIGPAKGFGCGMIMVRRV